MSFLTQYGWRECFAAPFAPFAAAGLAPARVTSEAQGLYFLAGPDGETLARIAGRLRHAALSSADFPAVGDWVAAQLPSGRGEGIIHAVLPRFSRFSRKVAGRTTEQQVVAANADFVFLVSALTREFNPRRLERYLVLAWDSGATPVLVLNKADLCTDLEAKLDALSILAAGVPVHPVSALAADGLADLRAYLAPGRTVAFLGSSGVGKSTLINRLTGRDQQAVGGVREDDRGRHTTTRRELLLVPGGGLLLDTPGMRELQLWESDEGLADTFHEVAALAAQCRFRDCRHDQEPGCAVRRALELGEVDEARFESFRKLQRELAYLARKEDQQAQAAEREKWRKINTEQRRNGHR